MWENRCKVAVSGVGFSTITRSAEIPLAAHALQAVQAAVEDSGLAMSDIDGLATYAELPATGHAIVDGISIVSVNCMMAMLKLPHLSWHVQVETVNIGGAVQQAVNALLAGQKVTTFNAASDQYDVVLKAQDSFRRTPDSIAAATVRTGGNQLRAAEVLGINRNTLRKKITDLGIEIPKERG